MKKRISSTIAIVLLLAFLVGNCFNNNGNIEIIDTEVPMASIEDSFGMMTFDNWQTGDYYYKTGEYVENEQRICMKEGIQVDSGNICVAHVSDTNYRILVRVMNADNKLIKSYNLADNDKFTIPSGSKEIRVGVYNVLDQKSGMTFDKYDELFAGGFTCYLSYKLRDFEKLNDPFGMKNLSNWKSGDYHYTTGKYNESSTRYCLNKEYEVNAGTEYTANITDEKFHILVREVDKNYKVISSRNLSDGMSFVTLDNTKKLLIGIYDVADKKSDMTEQKYIDLFDNGFMAILSDGIILDAEDIADNSKEDIPVDVPEDVQNDVQNDEFGMTEFSNWKSGNYYYQTGLYKADATRICLNDYVAVSAGKSYVANVSDSNYHILVREMDVNNKLLNSYNLAGGDKFTTASSVSKIGISIYDAKSKTTSFDMYKTLFENGFKATLTLEDGAIEDIIEVEEEIPVYGSSNNQNSSSDVTDVVYPDVKSEIIAMIQAGDTTSHNIRKYNVNRTDVVREFNSVIENECLLEYECSSGINVTYDMDGTYVKAITFKFFNTNYLNCLAKAKERITSVTSGIDNSMTELDKALYLYDNIIINTIYSNAETECYYGGNVLAYNKGACAGISSAYRLLLKEVGIDSTLVKSSSMRHGWMMLKIDGKWYHADPTWDNTRYRYSNIVSRHYFMRNDNEFNSTTCIKKHYDWKVDGGYSSSDTYYENWFVHDITEPMTYEDGYWVYTDAETGNLIKLKLDGSDIID